MTLDTIAASIRSELGVPATDTRRLPLSSVYEKINERMHQMCDEHNLPCALKTAADITMTAGQWTVDLTTITDWHKPASVRIKHAAESIKKLVPMTWWIAEQEYPDPTDATTWASSDNYAVYGSTLWILPPTDLAGTLLKLKYYQRFADLTAGSPGNTNALVVALGRALKYLAMGDCAAFLYEEARGNPYWSMGDTLLNDYMREQKTLVSDDRRPVAEEP